MLTDTLFFLLTFATLVCLAWSGYELFRVKEDPLADRLEELQAHAMAAKSASESRRRGGGGFLNTLLYYISVIPGGNSWLADTEKELAQAGVRRRKGLAYYALFQVIFLFTLLIGMAYLQRNNDLAPKFGGMMSALLLGWLLPQQVLHRLVKRYRDQTARRAARYHRPARHRPRHRPRVRSSHAPRQRRNGIHLSRASRRILHRSSASKSRPGSRDRVSNN